MEMFLNFDSLQFSIQKSALVVKFVEVVLTLSCCNIGIINNIELVLSSARITSAKFQQRVFLRPGPIDWTPGTWICISGQCPHRFPFLFAHSHPQLQKSVPTLFSRPIFSSAVCVCEGSDPIPWTISFSFASFSFSSHCPRPLLPLLVDYIKLSIDDDFYTELPM